VYIKGVKKEMGVRTLMLRGEGGMFKEVVGLATSPQQGGGKSIDRRMYSEVRDWP
jgi:hypothetical protein